VYREINKRLRDEFIEKIKAISPKRLVYVDECGVDQYLYREYAYAPRGQKVVAEISGKKFKRTNFCAGICLGKWVAPIEYDGTTNSVLFELWFEQCLLKEVKSGSVIVLDNATFHRKSVLPRLAAQKNCSVLFLPPYSPDLNPIENKWAWLKRKLRELLPCFSSFDDTVQNIFQVS
jgi:Transposase and inactivated derivatives